MSYIGIDLGTSAVKLLLMGEDGQVLATLSKGYPVAYPRPGWSEQDPAHWLAQTLQGLGELLQKTDPASVRGIGVAGQMHGLVLLDEQDRVIRPAILWNDGRSEPQVRYLNETVGRKTLSGATANIAFAGFTAPKLLWVRENEPQNYARIAKLMLPKDYLVYMLTGEHVTDLSDASGTLLLDVQHRCWSDTLCGICGVDPAWLPRLLESGGIAGRLKPEYRQQFGLGPVTFAAGAGDNAAAAVGTGTVGEGSCNLSLGTSGTLFISGERFRVDSSNALHAFCHADGGYHLMGCMLSAASCCGWWMEEILKTSDFAAEEQGMRENLGKNRVFFLPYLMGERSPLNDVNARGALIGMSMDTSRRDLLQAVLEGVGFALRDSLEVARGLGLQITESRVCGGGARDPVWLEILAAILNLELQLPAVEEGPAMGGAILAAVACGQFGSVQAAARALFTVKRVVRPDPALVGLYDKSYRVFRRLYPTLKGPFEQMAAFAIP